MNKPDTSWVFHLDCVGAPIRDTARDIQASVEAANERLREALAAHSESLAHCEREAERLENSIAKHWSPEEITAAKAGQMLVL